MQRAVRIQYSNFGWDRRLCTQTLNVVTHTMDFSQTPLAVVPPGIDGNPWSPSGLSLDTSVPCGAPLGGKNLKWLGHADAHGAYLLRIVPNR